MVLDCKAYIIPFDEIIFEQDLKFKILSMQIQHSLYLIKSDTSVSNERKKLRKVWSSFTNLAINKLGSQAIPINSNQYLILLKYYAECDILEKKPWIDCSMFSDFENGTFIIVPTGEFRLFNSVTNESVINRPEKYAVPYHLRKDPLKSFNWAINSKISLPTLTFGHDQITKAIHSYIYESNGQNSSNHKISFLYDDGSFGSSIDLPKLTKIPFTNTLDLCDIKLGLITRRHLEIDQIIDFYLLRDTEISEIGKNNSFSAQEEFSYNKFLEFFKGIDSYNHIKLSIYASGLIPANVGVIAALLEIKKIYPNKTIHVEFFKYHSKYGYSEDHKYIFS